MATPLSTEELDLTKRLIEDMRAKGRKYRDLSPKGQSLLDRYRAQQGQQATPPVTTQQPAPTQAPAPAQGPVEQFKRSFGFDKPFVGRGVAGAIDLAGTVAGVVPKALGKTAAAAIGVIPGIKKHAEQIGQGVETASGFALPIVGARLAAGKLIGKILKPASTAAAAATKAPAAAKTVERVNITNSPAETAGKVLGTDWEGALIRARTLGDRLKGETWQELQQLGIMKLTDAEDLALRALLEGKAAPVASLTPRVRAIGAAFRKMATKHADIFTTAKQEIWDPQTKTRVPFQRVLNYAPRVLDFQKLEKIPKAQLIADLQAANPGVAGPNIVQFAGALKGIVAGSPKLAMVKQVQRGLGPMHLKTRGTLDLPASIQHSMKESIPRYLDDASRELGAIGSLGPNDTRFLRALGKSAHPDKDAMLEAYKKVRRWSAPVGAEKQFSDLGRLSNNVAATMFLKVSTAVKQLSQTVPTWAKTPTRDMAHGYLKMFTQQGKMEAERAGAFTNDLANAAYGAISGRAGPGKLGKAIQLTSKSAEFVVKKTGTQAVDRFVRGVAYFAKKHELERMARSGTSRSQLGISFRGAGSVTEAIEMAAKEFADKVNLRTDVLSSPTLTSAPTLQFVRGLNMFAIQQSKMLYKEFIKPTLNPSFTRKYLEQLGADAKMVIGGEIVGEVINDTIAALTNKKRPQNVTRRLAENMAVIGTLGVLSPLTMGLFTEEDKSGPQMARTLSRNVEESASGIITGAGPAALTLPIVAATGGDAKKATRAAIPVIGDIVAGHLFPPKSQAERQRRRQPRRRR